MYDYDQLNRTVVLMESYAAVFSHLDLLVAHSITVVFSLLVAHSITNGL